MRYNGPTPEPIIRITHLPAIRNRAQQRSRAARAISRTEHAQIMPVVLTRTLPRYTLHIRGIVIGLQGLTGRIVPAIAVVDTRVEVGVVWVAGWDGRVEEAKVPLYDHVGISPYSF
jgi:hypothetical protein